MSISPEKLQRNIAFSVILAESTHVFCCVLPTIVTLLSVLSSLGVVTQVPVLMLDIHEMLHHYEIPIIAFSGAMLILGWVLYGISRKIECAKPHCEPHETVCTPHKNNTKLVLAIASVLFLVNITVYFTVHVRLEGQLHQAEIAAHHHD